MIPRRDEFLNILKGNTTSSNLKELKIRLVLIQVACALALEGITRATAGDISARAFKDYDMEILPSLTGLLFTNLNIQKLISHGKSRFVLEYEQLKGIREQTETKCKELADKLEIAIKTFHQTPERITDLQNEWAEIVKNHEEEQRLIRLINQEKKKTHRYNEKDQ